MDNTAKTLEFINKISDHATKVVEGKYALDSGFLRQMVREDAETAASAVLAYCRLAQYKPDYFQHATFLALAYEIEFNDDSLVEIVTKAVELAGWRPPNL